MNDVLRLTMCAARWMSCDRQAASDRFRAVSTGLVTAISSSQTPLWLLGFQCVGSAAAALCSAIVLSQKLHKAADRAESGEVRAIRGTDRQRIMSRHRVYT